MVTLCPQGTSQWTDETNKRFDKTRINENFGQYYFLSLVRHFECFENDHRHGDHVMAVDVCHWKLAYSRTDSDQVTHNHPTHIGPWMYNNSSEIFRKKQSVRCVWRQLTIPRLYLVFTHSASSVSINMQASPEGSCKRQSNVRFVRHLFKSPKATRSRTCPHLIISTDWWMFWLLKIAAHRPKNVAVVMRTTPLPLTVSCARTFYALLVLKLTNAWRPQEVIAMLW